MVGRRRARGRVSVGLEDGRVARETVPSELGRGAQHKLAGLRSFPLLHEVAGKGSVLRDLVQGVGRVDAVLAGE